MTTPAVMTSWEEVKAAVDASMPTPTPKWEFITREDSRFEVHHNHVAVCHIHFDATWFRYFVHTNLDLKEDGTVKTSLELHEHNLPHSRHIQSGEFQNRVQFVKGTTWDEFTTAFGVYLDAVCESNRLDRANWEFARAKLQIGGVDSYYVFDGGPSEPLPLAAIPSFKQRIHDVATVYDAWEDANTAESGADYVRTRTWWKVWIGYAWAEAGKATPRSSLEVLLDALGLGSRTITGNTQVMNWIIQHMEWWADAGVDLWRTTHNSGQVTSLMAPRNLNLFHVTSNGQPTEAVRGVVDQTDWDTYQNAGYIAARDWTGPEA